MVFWNHVYRISGRISKITWALLNWSSFRGDFIKNIPITCPLRSLMAFLMFLVAQHPLLIHPPRLFSAALRRRQRWLLLRCARQPTWWPVMMHKRISSWNRNLGMLGFFSGRLGGQKIRILEGWAIIPGLCIVMSKWAMDDHFPY